MTLLLFDPASSPAGAWPDGDLAAQAYIEEVGRQSPVALIRNVRTRWLALRSGPRVFPITVNEAESGGSYVCLPHSAYISYGRQELDLVDVGALTPIFRSAIAFSDRLLRSAKINKIVHIDNWLLSTNLHGDWHGEDLAEIRRRLVAEFPDHIIGLRSLDKWSCPQLLEAARKDGWRLLPSRQIWVTDELEVNWRKRNSTKQDFRVFKKSGSQIDEFDSMTRADAERISELYRMLYVDKYSDLNPVFEADYVAMTHGHGILRFRGVRDDSGQLVAIAGMLMRGGILTAPVVGYDTSRPQSEGLYRIACWLFSDFAARYGFRLNGSAGAGHFKRARGARGEIEYWAMFCRHLPPWRRTVVLALEACLRGLAVPMMIRRGL